jgi:peptidoglycan/LPS O-acetylase OafA/YrhL
MKIENKRFMIIFLAVVFLLLIPFIAMQFSNEVNWTLFDFIAAALLLLGTGFLCEFIIRKVKNSAHRIMLCCTLIIILLLIWAELAVGIFGCYILGL